MKLCNDVVLVLLSDVEPISAGGLILAPSFTPIPTTGRVVRIGPKVREIKPGDFVAFPPTVGEDYDIGAHRCRMLREPEIAAVIEKDTHA